MLKSREPRQVHWHCADSDPPLNGGTCDTIDGGAGDDEDDDEDDDEEEDDDDEDDEDDEDEDDDVDGVAPTT